MRTKEEAIAFGLSFPDSYIDRPFRTADWELIRFRENKKAFLLIYERNGLVNLNVKVHPEWRDFWRRVYPAVQPAYHQNKEHWNSIILDGSIPEEELKRMISESYALISDSPTKRIYEAVKKDVKRLNPALNIFRAAKENDLFWTRDLDGVYWICRAKGGAEAYCDVAMVCIADSRDAGGHFS